MKEPIVTYPTVGSFYVKIVIEYRGDTYMKKKQDNLDLTEYSDFHYLLTLLAPLQNEPEYQCLPELFSIIGHESLLKLCKYAGGTTIKIPTIKELSDALESLQWFYLVYIAKRKYRKSIPENLRPQVEKILKIYQNELK